MHEDTDNNEFGSFIIKIRSKKSLRIIEDFFTYIIVKSY